jgi:quinol monooxygenase YgiN
MGRIVIAAYRPKPGAEAELRRLVGEHVPRLRALGLVTERAPVAMAAADGVILEVFEWASSEAIAAAHEHPEVQAMWGEFAAVCDYVAPATVDELARPFPDFDPVF